MPIGASLERSAVYVPVQAAGGRRLRLVILLPDSGFSPGLLARRLSLARVADQLTWDGSAPPFVLLVPAHGTSPNAAISFANSHLPVMRGGAARVLGGVGDAATAALSEGIKTPSLARTLISLGAFFGALVYLFRLARDLLGDDERLRPERGAQSPSESERRSLSVATSMRR